MREALNNFRVVFLAERLKALHDNLIKPEHKIGIVVVFVVAFSIDARKHTLKFIQSFWTSGHHRFPWAVKELYVHM